MDLDTIESRYSYSDDPDVFNLTSEVRDLRIAADQLRADLARVTEEHRTREVLLDKVNDARHEAMAQRDRAEAALVEAREILEVVADDEAYPGGPFIVRRWLGRYAARNAPTTGEEDA